MRKQSDVELAQANRAWLTFGDKISLLLARVGRRWLDNFGVKRLPVASWRC